MSHSANFFDTGNTTVFYQGVEAGIEQERDRIIALVKGVWEDRCSPVMEPDECSVCWLVSNILEKIEGEKG